jgi:hypothetical protein
MVNYGGFDTHSNQVNSNDTTTGGHANLLKNVSDAIKAFQDDLNFQGAADRVVGMTFSEFGRQIASNASIGTDHGDAAPLFLFGNCINYGVIGPNPTIQSSIQDQAGVPMQIDFRNVYASILKDWFQVPSNQVQQMFSHPIQYYSLAGTCNVGNEELVLKKEEMLVYPNPCTSNFTIRVLLEEGRTEAALRDVNGSVVLSFFEQHLSAGLHEIPCDISQLPVGNYFVVLRNKDNVRTQKLVKTK